MITIKNDFLGSGMSYAELIESVEFSPNEPGIPFDDSMRCNVLAGRHELLIPGQLSSDLSVSNLVSPGQPADRQAVTNPEIWECF